jgi:sulfofructose kinase
MRATGRLDHVAGLSPTPYTLAMPSSGESPRWDVIGLGANSVDYVYLLPACPQPSGPGAKVRSNGHFVSCGGQIATSLACCGRLGLRAKYVGVTGSDANGRRIRDEMGQHGIDLTDAITRDAPNQCAVIMVDEQSGERIVVWERDDRLRLHDGDVPADVLGATRLLHVDDVDEEAAIRAARLARERGVVVTSDLDRITERMPELVRSVTVPIFAEHLPRALTGEDDVERALRKLRCEHHGLLVVTLGARGAVALDGDRLLHSPGFRVNAVDTTGAGDVFRGGFIHALLAGRSPGEILRFANAAAAVSCTRRGAMNGAPSLDEVMAVMGKGGAGCW